MSSSLTARPRALHEKHGLLYYLKKDAFIYMLIAPGILYYIVFKYIPMFGVIIAFKDYEPFLGVEGIFTSPWVGLTHIRNFLSSYYSLQVLRNTFVISLLRIVWGFPAPIILALMLNEVRNSKFKRVVQTISYLPYFLSVVIVCGIVRSVTSTDGGLINLIITAFGGEPIYLLGSTKYFRTILVSSGIWQGVGWGSIIYLAAMVGIDPEQYEAAIVDGASLFRRMWHITLPGILPVVSIQLILTMGSLLNAGFDQIFLLYSPVVYSVADVTSTFVYREALIQQRFSYGAAVDLFTSLVGMALVLTSNAIAKRMGQEGIW